ncbi:MAG: hypothetical protein N3A66_10265, partial [Planctomycetota bacterium]|nr:hypothetical protein [Planctomycetota bacterium]
MRNLIIAGMAVMLASAFLFSAEDDAEWRRRTGADPGKKTETPFAPTDVPDLILWLDANQGIMLDDQNRVAKWEDQSGSGNHLAAPNESLRPALKKAALNGMPVVSCAGFHGDHTQTFAQGVSGEIEISDQGISVFALVRQREEIFASCLFKYGPDNHKAGIGISMNRFGAWVDPDKDFSFNISSDRDLVGQGFQLLCLTCLLYTSP